MAGELAYDPTSGQLVFSPATGQLALNCGHGACWPWYALNVKACVDWTAWIEFTDDGNGNMVITPRDFGHGAPYNDCNCFGQSGAMEGCYLNGVWYDNGTPWVTDWPYTFRAGVIDYKTKFEKVSGRGLVEWNPDPYGIYFNDTEPAGPGCYEANFSYCIEMEI